MTLNTFKRRLTALGLSILLAGALLQAAPPDAKASGQLWLPFSLGKTWFVCQGYNTAEIDHVGTMINALDLSVDPTSASGTYGCTGSATASQGLTVSAPSSGTIVSYCCKNPIDDMVCIAFDIGGSAHIGHMGNMLPIGTHVPAGYRIGSLNPPNTTKGDGEYSHIHIELHTSNNCSGTSIPFDDANNMRFQCAPDLSSNGSAHQNYRTYLSRCGTVSSPATTSALLNVEVTLGGISPIGVDNNAPRHPQRAVTIEVFNNNWQLVANKATKVTYNNISGAFVTTLNLGSTWRSGTYFIKVRLPNALRQTMGRYSGSTFSIAPGKKTYLPRTPMFTGDINNDNIINILDYNILLNCWQKNGCNPGSTAYVSSDLNDDDQVNQTDYTVWLRANKGASSNCSNGTCVYNQVW
jgi:hypothetical protein